LSLGEVVGFATGSANSHKGLLDLSEQKQANWKKYEADPVLQDELVKKVRLDAKKEYLTLAESQELEDHVVLQCLRVRRFDPEAGAKLLEEYVKFRREQSWPLQMTKEDVEKVANSQLHSVLATNDTMGRPILTMVVHKLDFDKASAQEFQKLGVRMLEELTFHNPKIQDEGIALLLDLDNTSLRKLGGISKADMDRGMEIFTRFPVKIKHVYITNAALVYRVAIKTVLLAASSSARASVTVVSSKTFKELRENVADPDLLPAAYSP